MISWVTYIAGKPSRTTFSTLMISILFYWWFLPACSAVSSYTAITQDRGVLLHTKRDRVRLTVCNESVVHVQALPDEQGMVAFDAAAAPWIRRPCDDGDFRFRRTATVATIETTQLRIEMSLREGTIVFKDAGGKMLLEEVSAGSRTYDAIGSESHVPLYRISERFHLSQPTTLYGLGQHQAALFNYNGSSVTLAQYNTDIDIPLAISGAGYGLLWNSAAKTVFNNQIPARLEITQSAGRGLDFYFLYGPEADQVIHLYRTLTGHAPMLAQWAYGLIQSKNRYTSQEELVHTVDEYRQRHIPLDTIVQDYYWWTTRGSNEFNSQYPAIEKALQHIHEQHAHTMISIWPNLDMKTKLYQEMAAHHLLIQGSDVYDATSTEAQALYWNELPRALLAKGIDALWLDASEPEIGNGREEGIPTGTVVAAGSGALEANAFPFFHTKGISQHWHEQEADKRVFLLTRSAFLGQQANGAAIWSGDIETTFDSLRRQVPAGLNLMLSGIPYWTTDIGGYSYPDGDPGDPRYRELFTRWFEYGTFCPLFRIHGRRVGNNNELWSYGEALPTLLKFDKLRYALSPYIYSLAYRVTNDDYTIMRPLVMDWRKDPRVSLIGDSFMFGPALLVSPITQEGAIERDVYLPATRWYDFWTGEKRLGGQTVHASAPLDRIPLYVRAGSIVPFGPDIEYAGEKVDAPIELRIYPGADGSFDLYSDQGDGYGYEHGAEAVIPITWDETTKTLTIGSRVGSFQGMSERQTFRIIWVRPNHGAGSEATAQADETVQYMGRSVTVVHP